MYIVIVCSSDMNFCIILQDSFLFFRSFGTLKTPVFSFLALLWDDSVFLSSAVFRIFSWCSPVLSVIIYNNVYRISPFRVSLKKMHCVTPCFTRYFNQSVKKVRKKVCMILAEPEKVRTFATAFERERR